jgi:hypothetical protein
MGALVLGSGLVQGDGAGADPLHLQLLLANA